VIREASIKEAGFTGANNRIDIPQTLSQWQSAGDQRLFKLISSRNSANASTLAGTPEIIRWFHLHYPSFSIDAPKSASDFHAPDGAETSQPSVARVSRN
jgi:hypothetical protein